MTREEYIGLIYVTRYVGEVKLINSWLKELRHIETHDKNNFKCGL